MTSGKTGRESIGNSTPEKEKMSKGKYKWNEEMCLGKYRCNESRKI